MNKEVSRYLGSMLAFGVVIIAFELLFSVNDLISFLSIGVVCFIFNKPLAREITNLYIFPVRWLFGEKKWISIAEYYLFLWMRLTLYFGVLISLIVIFLEIAGQ
jgi:hypothetical protein